MWRDYPDPSIFVHLSRIAKEESAHGTKDLSREQDSECIQLGVL